MNEGTDDAGCGEAWCASGERASLAEDAGEGADWWTSVPAIAAARTTIETAVGMSVLPVVIRAGAV